MPIPQLVNDGALALIRFARRRNPAYRDALDRVFRGPAVRVTQGLINLLREKDDLAVAEERTLPGEEVATQQIIERMTAFLRTHYTDAPAERAGNTKTYGVVRGTLTVGELPADLRVGLFAEPRTYPAWVRFAGPGPLATPDVDNNGVLSIGIKVMGVEGPKLIDDERHTQDFTGISAPTFTTPDVFENVKLQRAIGQGRPAWYFLNPRDSHYLDMIMQGLFAKTHASPLELPYYSCVPYLYGPGRAVKLRFRPIDPGRSRVPRPFRDDYLREAMVRTLSEQTVDFEVAVQFQTDPRRMPIENASVIWPEKASPYVAVATLRLPQQTFDSEAQLRFARSLSFNPWHCLSEHRPLGNQNRARKAIYLALSQARQRMNGDARVEPTGEEVFA